MQLLNLSTSSRLFLICHWLNDILESSAETKDLGNINTTRIEEV
jgi:hypothetical protein